MPILGLVGGMSWHSSALYYRRLNEAAERRWGTGRTAESVLVTLPFADLQAAGQRGDWPAVTARIVDAARATAAAGAAAVLLTAFTGHIAAAAVEEALDIPLLHAGDALAAATKAGPVGLLGTAATLSAGLIEARLAAHGITVLQPDGANAAALDAAIQGDLAAGRVTPAAEAALAAAASALAARGARCLALACTELPLLSTAALPLPVIDGIDAHVSAALDWLETA
ncbi:MAG: amino acid racemase [Pseudomonadota bacterium]